MTLVIWSAIAIFIICALGFYALMLLIKLKKQNIKKSVLETQNLQKNISKNINVLSSINLIGKAMEQKQCEISEGCWRISVLVESLPEYKHKFKSSFPSVFQLYNAIQHMPILDERKKLSKKEKIKLDVERMSIEQQLEDSVMSEVLTLQSFAMSTIKSLQKQIIK